MQNAHWPARFAMAGVLATLAAAPSPDLGEFRPDPPIARAPQTLPDDFPYQELETETTTLEAAEDAWVSSDRSGENFGGDSRLFVGQRPGYGATRTLIYFDMDDVPDNEVVIDGELKLRLQEAGPGNDPGRDIVVRRVRGSWDEDEVKWTNFPSTADERLAELNIGRSSGWYTWDIGRLARRWWSGEWDNEGLYVQGFEADGSYRAFASSESSNEPELELEVVIDDVPPMATMNPLPPFINTPDFPISWTEGEDPDPGTGIDVYRLFGRRNEEQWLQIGGDQKTTSGVFQGAESGVRYSFRVDAVDVAGNQEPGGPAEATTLVDYSAPSTTLQPLPEFTAGPIVLTWTGVDLPNEAGKTPAGIAHYDLQFKGEGGDWADLALGITGNTHRIETPVQGARYDFRVRAVDKAGNFEPLGPVMASTRVDGLPPIVWFSAVSGIDNPEFTVRWNAVDPGGSGVVSLDIQYRIDGGPWQDWLIRTTERSKVFSGEMGHMYEFRARGRDVAGNTGTYPAKAQRTVVVIEGDSLTSEIFLPFGETRFDLVPE